MNSLKKEPLFYDFCRVTAHLPVSNIGEKKAANEVIARLKQSFPGLTYTSSQHSQIIGFWSDKSGKVYDDSIALVIIDLSYSINKDIKEIGETVDEIKELIKDTYETYRSKQLEVWVTLHPILVRLDWRVAKKVRKAVKGSSDK